MYVLLGVIVYLMMAIGFIGILYWIVTDNSFAFGLIGTLLFITGSLVLVFH